MTDGHTIRIYFGTMDRHHYHLHLGMTDGYTIRIPLGITD